MYALHVRAWTLILEELIDMLQMTDHEGKILLREESGLCAENVHQVH